MKVTKVDIEKGRLNAKKQCGCPIWHAVNRQLKLNLDADNEKVLAVTDMYTVVLRGDEYNLKMTLPEEAAELQRILRTVPQADVKPITFDVKLRRL